MCEFRLLCGVTGRYVETLLCHRGSTCVKLILSIPHYLAFKTGSNYDMNFTLHVSFFKRNYILCSNLSRFHFYTNIVSILLSQVHVTLCPLAHSLACKRGTFTYLCCFMSVVAMVMLAVVKAVKGEPEYRWWARGRKGLRCKDACSSNYRS